MDKIAFKCYECNTINVFPKTKTDGHNCFKCGGILAPIGEAIDADEFKEKQCIHKFNILNTSHRGTKVEILFYCERCLKFEKKIKP